MTTPDGLSIYRKEGYPFGSLVIFSLVSNHISTQSGNSFATFRSEYFILIKGMKDTVTPNLTAKSQYIFIPDHTSSPPRDELVEAFAKSQEQFILSLAKNALLEHLSRSWGEKASRFQFEYTTEVDPQKNKIGLAEAVFYILHQMKMHNELEQISNSTNFQDFRNLLREQIVALKRLEIDEKDLLA